MGEIADMMLDGTLCQYCGEFLGGEDLGYPQSCQSCSVDHVQLMTKKQKKKKKRDPNKPFIITDCYKSHYALKFWLKDKNYNYFLPDMRDREGSPMIKLFLNSGDGDDKCAGVIIIRDESSHNKIIKMVDANLKD